jgi:hypothetical protein
MENGALRTRKGQPFSDPNIYYYTIFSVCMNLNALRYGDLFFFLLFMK